MAPPALMAAMPVGASTTCFFFVVAHTYFKNVDLPVPAFPVRKMELRVKVTRSSACLNSGVDMSMSLMFNGQRSTVNVQWSMVNV